MIHSSLYNFAYSLEKLVLLNLCIPTYTEIVGMWLVYYANYFYGVYLKHATGKKTFLMKNMGNSLGYGHQAIWFSTHKPLYCSFPQNRTSVGTITFTTSNLKRTGEILVLQPKQKLTLCRRPEHYLLFQPPQSNQSASLSALYWGFLS